MNPATTLARTPFARLFPEDTSTPHRFEKAHEWNELPICAKCGCMEGALLLTCPVQRLTFAEAEIAYEAFGNLMKEFRAGVELRREMEVEWEAPLQPSIANYNELARRFNDDLMDLEAHQREIHNEDHAVLTLHPDTLPAESPAFHPTRVTSP